MGCCPIRVYERIYYLADKTISKAFLQNLCNYIAEKIFKNLQLICSKTRNISITKIGSDFFYQIYANRYPLGIRWFEKVILVECPGLPSLADRLAQAGVSYFPEGLRFTYAEGLERLEKSFAERASDKDCVFTAYARLHYKEYEDPEFRKIMARRYLTDQLECDPEGMKEWGKYGFVVSQLCQKEINELYWREFRNKMIESERQLFRSIAKALSTGGPIEDSYDAPEEPPSRIVDGYPPYTFEDKTWEERLQTPEEHRLEWNETPLLTKIEKFIIMPISNKEKLGFIIGCWILHNFVLKKLL